MTVLYPSGDGSTFDHDYFRDTHVPMAVKAWSLDGAQVLKGFNGPYVASVEFAFADQDALNAAFGAPGTAEVMADVPNYTNITPVMQMSEMVD
jgi:uncharacterized protein (TIGR02118 family)